MTTTKADRKMYVLREKDCYRIGSYRYYTGYKPTRNIADAKRFNLKTAQDTKEWADTGWCYDIILVTDKMRFIMILSGQ